MLGVRRMELREVQNIARHDPDNDNVEDIEYWQGVWADADREDYEPIVSEPRRCTLGTTSPSPEPFTWEIIGGEPGNLGSEY
jgi:hypothetical protein